MDQIHIGSLKALRLVNIDECYVRVETTLDIEYELRDYFTFKVPGAEFSPKFKARLWDGNIRIFNINNHQIYRGLVPAIKRFAEERGYDFEYDDFLDEFSIKEARDFASLLKLPFEVHDHQLEAFVHAIRNRRAILLSPTSSGKSLIIYMLLRYLIEEGSKKVLIIVPTTNLVLQLFNDFKDYRFPSDKYVHRIYEGQDKDASKPIYISTWQSIYEQPKSYFEKFDVVIGDEAHLYKAKSIVGIMSKLTKAKHRIGLTGTLDGSKTNKLVLEGLFGQVQKVISTKELMDKGIVADFDIKALVLKHPPEACKQMKGAKYQDEIEYLVLSEARNRFICNLALSLTGNTLVLFQYVDKHGKVLFDLIKQRAPTRPVHFISGEVEADVRESIRRIVETQEDAIIVASFGTTSTGINIKSIRNVIFTSPSKARVKILQSIGRALRISQTKNEATLYDIADDLKTGKKDNYTLTHFIERLKTYAEEKFKFKVYKLNLKG